MGLIFSAGGQVFDRTTGTWEGVNQGVVGGADNYSHLDGKVWRDANGITGVQISTPVASNGGNGGSGSASPQVTNGVTSGPAGGSGPGSARVTNGGSEAGGSGAGSLAVGTSVWWDKVGEASAVPGSLVLTSALPPLQPVMKGDNTAIQIGGRPFMPAPGTSDASEIENMLGDGDNPLEAAWWFKQAAFISHAGYNLQLWANDPATQAWAAEFDQGVMGTFGDVGRGLTWQR